MQHISLYREIAISTSEIQYQSSCRLQDSIRFNSGQSVENNSQAEIIYYLAASLHVPEGHNYIHHQIGAR